MERKYSEAFIKQYLYNKLKHVDRYEFTLNFSDISMDLRPYIESNYFEYINVVYDSDVFINEHTNMLHRNYVNRYVWVRRDELLSLLKKEGIIINAIFAGDIWDDRDKIIMQFAGYCLTI